MVRWGHSLLFTDGNRIDLHIETKENMIEGYGHDKLTVPLLDKDNCLPAIPKPTDTDYHVTRPAESMFMSCCNNFWWCQQNVAKGIWRDELPYAMQMFEHVIRAELDKMVSWWMGMNNHFEVSTGKMGKYFKHYLPEDYWEMYKKTYSDGNYEHMWDSIFAACHLFRTLANKTAVSCKFSYPHKDDKNMTNYQKHIKNLPTDAEKIY
ncbi:aminoglycoside 6-adenylyltransferase [Lentibacillus sp. N15]|uniref:aminoglycoside 6-adenylyltransferase n=1 Tax=Lentibacillus songyuanensis TaxID=3136161 RepID=UPI0031BAB0E2